jgi:hypothetical protein
MLSVSSARLLIICPTNFLQGLACSAIIKDPYLVWVFGVPTAIGAVVTPLFWWMYKDIDREEYRISHDVGEYKEVHGIQEPRDDLERRKAQ